MDSSYTNNFCTDPDILKAALLRSDIRLEGMVFMTYHSVGFFQCLRYCLISSDCFSINFQSVDGYCELNVEKDDIFNGTLVTEFGFGLVNKEDMPKELAGPCKDVDCGSQAVCERDINGNPQCQSRPIPNIAFGRPTQQSSHFVSNYHCCQSSHGVDGVTGGYLDNACAVTDYNDFSPWWEVRFNTIYNVTGIEIYSANDTEGVGMLHDFGILVSRRAPLIDENACCRFVKGTLPFGRFKINCLRPVSGDRLRIHMQKTQILLLCEVKVFTVEGYESYNSASAPTSCLKRYGFGMSSGKPVTASGIISGDVTYLVDGNRNMLDINGAQCVSAAPTSGSRWFEIDLGAKYPIESVVVYNKEKTNDIDTTLTNLTIRSYVLTPTYSITTCATYEENFGSTSRIFECEPVVEGRYVLITSTGPNLHLCEVEVTII
ncbi:hypothetical protein LOTGIDRAFT_171238 [Lottia gigantea]|uniref:Fucolectin tachylectin-4 pentraxin-1 domain-containing protein n=1 Tax=Lottia gigantea TaxID=225164 RepID=V4B0I0_LOTGI|nr:hypothetical protein LOTGIDRAFT_171238 [Lottia gigantea]ESP03593.1 hypothetical protein LOTGIDRAFT_171238 [Lottia gigantea]